MPNYPNESTLNKTNCPNCGAPFGPDRICEYCGTGAEDILRMSMNKPMVVSVELDGIEYTMTLLLEDFRLHVSNDVETLYADASPYYTFTSYSTTNVELNARMVPFDTQYGKIIYIKKRHK